MKKFGRFIAVLIISTMVLIPLLGLGNENNKEQVEKEFQKLSESKEGPAMVAAVQFILWRAGYFGTPSITGKLDEDTKKALRSYQKRRGLSVSGNLDAKTFDQIVKDSDLMDPEPISTSGFFFFKDMWDSYFNTYGTWVFENNDEKMASPVQKTQIKCYRGLMLCVEATADILFNSLNVQLEKFDIERWDEHELVTKPYDYQCVRYVLRINREHRSVKKLRTKISKEEFCKGIDAGDKYLRLINGFDEYWEFRKNLYEKRRKIYSPDLKQQFQKLNVLSE